jgi:hypothetical protein
MTWKLQRLLALLLMTAAVAGAVPGDIWLWQWIT